MEVSQQISALYPRYTSNTILKQKGGGGEKQSQATGSSEGENSTSVINRIAVIQPVAQCHYNDWAILNFLSDTPHCVAQIMNS
jgi:hypothetical protein